MTKKPSEADFELAACWLRINDGDNGESEACNRVAEWLDERRRASRIREAAREAGIPVAMIRARLKQTA